MRRKKSNPGFRAFAMANAFRAALNAGVDTGRSSSSAASSSFFFQISGKEGYQEGYERDTILRRGREIARGGVGGDERRVPLVLIFIQYKLQKNIHLLDFFTFSSFYLFFFIFFLTSFSLFRRLFSPLHFFLTDFYRFFLSFLFC